MRSHQTLVMTFLLACVMVGGVAHAAVVDFESLAVGTTLGTSSTPLVVGDLEFTQVLGGYQKVGSRGGDHVAVEANASNSSGSMDRIRRADGQPFWLNSIMIGNMGTYTGFGNFRIEFEIGLAAGGRYWKTYFQAPGGRTVTAADLGVAGVALSYLHINLVSYAPLLNYYYDDIDYSLTAPIDANAGADQTVEGTSPAGADVALDGSGSVGAASYEWSEAGAVLATGATPTVTLGLGVHTVTLTATGEGGASDTDQCVITVEDTTAPSFTLNVLQARLWPANHKLLLAATVTGISDICDLDPAVDIVVTSNEPLNGPGSGNTEEDWVIVQNGDTWEIWLRAERDGPCDGRIYDVSVTVTDDSGNAAADAATAVVPHDQGKKGK